MNVQRMFFERVVFSPDKVEQFLAGQHASRVLQENTENPELLRRELDRSPLDSHLMAIEIHGKRIDSKFPERRGLQFLPPEECLDDGQPFTMTVGIDDAIESCGKVLYSLLLRARRPPWLKCDHGNALKHVVLSQGCNDLVSPVDERQFEGGSGGEGQGNLSRRREGHMIPVRSQEMVDHRCTLFVFGHEEHCDPLMPKWFRRLLHSPMLPAEGCRPVSRLLRLCKYRSVIQYGPVDDRFNKT